MNEILNFFQQFYYNHLLLSWIFLIVGFPEVEIVLIIGIVVGFVVGR